jgi:protein required for attachment to host cells
MTPSGMHSAEQSENLGMEKERRFSHILAQELFHRLQQHQYEELILTAPHEHLNEFREALHNDVQKRLVETIPKLLTKEPLPEILERIQKTH